MLILAGCALAGAASAQVANSPVVFANENAVTASLVNPPLIGDSEASAPGEAPQWLKVEFHYSVNPPKTPFLDQVEFKVWIEGRDLYAANAPGTEGVAVALTGTVDYVNLPKARDAYGVFYVHPSTLVRYSSAAGVSDFDRKFNVHVEAYVGGAKVDYFDKFKDPSGKLDWFVPLTPVSGLVYRKDQSPFNAVDVSHYPAIKLAGSPGQ